MRLLCPIIALLLLPAEFCCAETSANPTATTRLQAYLGKTFRASDSIHVDFDIERSEDARACLRGLAWKPADFAATCLRAPTEGCGDALVRFPSPIDSGDASNDSVAMEWYAALGEQQEPIRARAVVVVHESGSGMSVGRMFARGLQQRGFHAFMIQLPYYGQRRQGPRPEDKRFFTLIRQAIADVRRARDAVAALPLVDDSHIALQGTSLGGFVSATSAALDDRYDSVFLTLAGGNLFDMIENGQKDAAKVRERLRKAGLSGDQLRDAVYHIEPTRVAHRLNAESTWLYSGTLDTVVPMENAIALATAARLDESHHVKLFANHYLGIIYLPVILDHIRDQITGAK